MFFFNRLPKLPKAKAYKKNQQLLFSFLGAVYIACLFSLVIVIVAYRTNFGPNSQAQKWVNQNATSYSVEVYEMIFALKSLVAELYRYKSNPTVEQDILKQKLGYFISVLRQLDLSTPIGKAVGVFAGYTDAINKAQAVIDVATKVTKNRSAVNYEQIDEVNNSAEAGLRNLFFTALHHEFTVRDGMVQTITNVRSVAIPGFWLGMVMLLLGTFVLGKLYQTSRKITKLETERFERLEFLMNSIGHDLRGPLQAILGATGLLRKTLPSEESYLKIIQDSTKQLARLIDDFGSIAQDERLNFMPQPFKLIEWCEGIKLRYQVEANRKGLRLEADIDSAIDRPWIYFDRERLSQCVSNLLDNAIRYTSSGIVKFSLKLLPIDKKHIINNQEALLKIEISDTGTGINALDQEKIFKPFFRGGNIKGNGRGLGLAIVSNIVRSGNGSITCISELNVGSVFTLTFPVTLTDPDKESQSLTHGTTVTSGECKQNKLKILLVDDEEKVRNSLCKILTNMGYVVDTAANGVEALEMVNCVKYDALITDVQMPEMNGYELAEKCQKLRPSIIKIAVTAFTSAGSKKQPSNLFDHVLYKPVDDEELFKVLLRYDSSKDK